jgi:hypothetical protein
VLYKLRMEVQGMVWSVKGYNHTCCTLSECFNHLNYAQVYGGEWIVVWILRNCDDEPITQHDEVCSSLHFVESQVSLG